VYVLDFAGAVNVKYLSNKIYENLPWSPGAYPEEACEYAT
jgi:hypothetical protein